MSKPLRIDHLKPGSKLDRLIAERLGVDLSDIVRPEHDSPMEIADMPDYPCRYCGTPLKDQKLIPCVETIYPHSYSTNRTYIFELVRIVKEKYGLYLLLQEYQNGWVAEFWDRERNETVGWYPKSNDQADPVFAICLAFMAIPQGRAAG